MSQTTGDITATRRVVRTLLLTLVAVVVAPLLVLGVLVLGLYTIQLICELLT